MISIRALASPLGLWFRSRPVTATGRRRRSQGQSASQPGRQGVTLLELIVVLALLGLVLAIAAPAFIVPTTAATSDLGAAVATARRAAVLRGEPVTLSVDDAGAWHVDGDASSAAPSIATGRLTRTVGRLRVRVSPLGTCIPEPIAGAPAQDWNALGCSLAAPATASRQ